MDQGKRFKTEAIGMATIILLVVIGGGIYLWKEDQVVQKKRSSSNTVSKRYDVGSLHYVAPELILYQNAAKFQTGLKDVWGLAPDGEHVLACGTGGIKRFDLEGNEKLHIPISEEVRFVKSGKDGSILAAINNRIEAFDKTGAKINTYQSKEWGSVNAFAFAGDKLFVADGSNRVIWKCKEDGTVISKFGSQDADKKNGLIIPGKYLDIDFGKDGLLYVTNPGRHNVNAYNQEGKLELVMGHPSFKHVGFSGCCNPVALDVMQSGNVITTEKGIARVKILDKDGNLVGIIAPPVDFRANKHAFIIDVVENNSGSVFALNNGSKEIFVYTKKKA